MDPWGPLGPWGGEICRNLVYNCVALAVGFGFTGSQAMMWVMCLGTTCSRGRGLTHLKNSIFMTGSMSCPIFIAPQWRTGFFTPKQLAST